MRKLITLILSIFALSLTAQVSGFYIKPVEQFLGDTLIVQNETNFTGDTITLFLNGGQLPLWNKNRITLILNGVEQEWNNDYWFIDKPAPQFDQIRIRYPLEGEEYKLKLFFPKN